LVVDDADVVSLAALLVGVDGLLRSDVDRIRDPLTAQIAVDEQGHGLAPLGCDRPAMAFDLLLDVPLLDPRAFEIDLSGDQYLLV